MTVEEDRYYVEEIMKLLKNTNVAQSIAILDQVKFNIQMTAWENTR